MVQLTTEQRAYLIKTFYETRSLQITCESFMERFPERQAPALKTVWANVRKFEAHGTCLNRNKGNSGRSRTGRSERILKLCDNDWPKIRGARVLERMESVFLQRPLTALQDLT